MRRVEATWVPDAETLAEGYRFHRATPAARRSMQVRSVALGVFLLAVVALAVASGNAVVTAVAVLFAILAVRLTLTGNRRWVAAFLRSDAGRLPQRLAVGDSGVEFALGDAVTSWAWAQIAAVVESPHTFTFVVGGASMVVLPRTTLGGDDEQLLRGILAAKNKLVSA